jgi:hypothetical protein
MACPACGKIDFRTVKEIPTYTEPALTRRGRIRQELKSITYRNGTGREGAGIGQQCNGGFTSGGTAPNLAFQNADEGQAMVWLTDFRMADGSRHFGSFKMSVDWVRVRNHVNRLAGAELTGVLTDHVTEAWIDFQYQDHAFTIHTVLDEYWFFVNDSECPISVLQAVTCHFAKLLVPWWVRLRHAVDDPGSTA